MDANTVSEFTRMEGVENRRGLGVFNPMCTVLGLTNGHKYESRSYWYKTGICAYVKMTIYLDSNKHRLYSSWNFHVYTIFLTM